ncbi:MAG: TrmB family transcriptional regulator [Promethearchaeota archaeon]
MNSNNIDDLSVSEYVVRALEGINLTQYEIALYLTLVMHGKLNAKALSEKSNVPYSRIYNILNMLLDKGFIKRDDTERPTVFIANPPDEALMLARKRLIDDFNKNSKIIVNELQDIYLKNSNLPIRVSILVYRGKEAVFGKACRILKNASSSIMATITDLQIMQSNGIFNIIKEKYKGGIREIKFLIQEQEYQDPRNSGIIEELNSMGQVRMLDQLFGTGIVVDTRDAIILLRVPIFGFSAYFGLRSDYKEFGSVAKGYFNYLFNSATDLN